MGWRIVDGDYDLVGIDGNAYSILGYVTGAMKDMKFSKAEIEEFTEDAMSQDYDYLLYRSADMIQECNKRLHETEED